MPNPDVSGQKKFADIPLSGPLVVFDLEWTAWEGSRERNWSGPKEEREIIEIGAVKLDGANDLIEILSCEYLVRPMRNPIVSNYFTELTGITQTLIDNEAMPFRDAITLFEGFVGYEGTQILSFSQDAEVLRHNCDLNHLPWPFEDSQFHNIAPVIANTAGLEPGSFSTSELPTIFSFSPPENAHRALSDARCIAETLRVLYGGNRLLH